MYSRGGMEEPKTPRGKRCRKLGQLRRTETDGTRQGEDEARRDRLERDRHSRMCLKGGQRRHLISQGHQII